jgi:hypothetical protein
MKDQVHGRDPRVPVLVDSSYYKILAKCRTAGVRGPLTYDCWRTFPQPDRLVHLGVSPSSAWRRRGDGAGLTSREYEGDMPGSSAIRRICARCCWRRAHDRPVTELPESPSVEPAVEVVREVLTS